MITSLKPATHGFVYLAALALTLGSAGIAQAKKCPVDSVKVGAICVDKYEASVWSSTNPNVVKSIQKGKIDSVADLAGATQYGVGSDDYGVACPDTGNGCTAYYAVSLGGVTPAANITWFQAAAACRNSAKRLATNQEWQAAALGTPDPGTDDDTTDCAVSSVGGAVATGSRSSCLSDAGASDLVGNLEEWVADWGDHATNCVDWIAMYGGDLSCIGGDGSINEPSATARGGNYADGAEAGVFAARGNYSPTLSSATVGFRCARQP